MKINIADVKAGQDQEFSYVTNAEELEIPTDVCEFEDGISVSGIVRQTGSAYRVQGSIRCRKKFCCDRCLKPSVTEQTHEFSEDFCTDAERAEREAIGCIDGEILDITEMIRDTLLAAQPLSNICRPDCRGLCPVCGADLNLEKCTCEPLAPDPRLAVLQQFKSK